MEISVGTFNLNNLFSRFNFKAHVDELPPNERDVTVTHEFDEEGDFWFRTFRGRLIQPMLEEQLTARIKTMDLDVLAVQEVEDIEALRDFVRFHLDGLYPNGPDRGQRHPLHRRGPGLKAPDRRSHLLAARDPLRGSL
jgi:hypothetical protein